LEHCVKDLRSDFERHREIREELLRQQKAESGVNDAWAWCSKNALFSPPTIVVQRSAQNAHALEAFDTLGTHVLKRGRRHFVQGMAGIVRWHRLRRQCRHLRPRAIKYRN
jgi:hypothetical protein